MSNKNYIQGRHYEYVERDSWRKRGYHSERQYGSKGVFDVYAIKQDGTKVVFISVKSYQKRRGSYKADIRKLAKMPAGPAVVRMHVEYGPIKRGVKTPRRERVIE